MLGQNKAQILTENIIFIILNLVFLTILLIFVYSKSGGEAVLEEKYAKQIALIIDSARPGMEMQLNMEDAIQKASNNGLEEGSIVSIAGNTVNVKLREGKGYSYDFFNEVDVSSYLGAKNPETGKAKDYVIIINDYK